MYNNPYQYGPMGYNYGPAPDQLAQLRQQQTIQPMQQPMMGQQMQQQPAQQQTMSGPVYVNGEAGAKGFIVGPGQTVMLIDADPEANTFWLKSADASGMPSMRTFDYTERVAVQRAAQAPAAPTVEYVTRADFDRLTARADALAAELETLKARKCSCSKKAVKENEDE